MQKISEKRKLDLTDREIAESVQKVGGGTPSDNSIRVWREKFEADPEWYPGKQLEDAEKPGRKKVITKLQEAAIAKSAMSLKRKGVEPTVAAVTAQCPAATLNPETDEPFTAKVILEVFPGHRSGKLYTLLRGGEEGGLGTHRKHLRLMAHMGPLGVCANFQKGVGAICLAHSPLPESLGLNCVPAVGAMQGSRPGAMTMIPTILGSVAPQSARQL